MKKINICQGLLSQGLLSCLRILHYAKSMFVCAYVCIWAYLSKYSFKWRNRHAHLKVAFMALSQRSNSAHMYLYIYGPVSGAVVTDLATTNVYSICWFVEYQTNMLYDIPRWRFVYRRTMAWSIFLLPTLRILISRSGLHVIP